MSRTHNQGRLFFVALCIPFVVVSLAWAELPNSVLNNVFPAGGPTGKTIEVTISGSALDGLATLRSSCPGLTFQKGDKSRFRVTIPKETPTGLYDLRAISANGLSSPRTFFVGNRTEQLEAEPNNEPKTAPAVPLDVVVNGRIQTGGDLDHFPFAAKRGQRVVIECWAERIDSRLRAVLELYDQAGRRLAVNRGYFGIDPLIEYRVPADGTYVVKVFDLIYSGSADHFYRLDIDTGPRVAFAVPCVVERGKTTRVTLHGWNLKRDAAGVARSTVAPPTVAGSVPARGNATRPEQGLRRNVSKSKSRPAVAASSRANDLRRTSSTFDRLEVDITPPKKRDVQSLSVRLTPPQVAVDGFTYHYPGGHAPILIGVTDVPVVRDQANTHSLDRAPEILCPCEVSGQLVAGDERDWFAIQAKRGEVFWIEAFGERISSPVDLDVSVLDASGEKELARFSDDVKNIGGIRFPSHHLDPAGRFVVPSDGRYLLMVRNLIGGLDDDPRRVYRLSVRREEPDFHLAVVSRRNAPAGLNVVRGGRSIVDVLAFRRRGLNGSIRVSAKDLPAGIECPDIWLGPGVNRAPLVVTADNNAKPFIGTLNLQGHAELAGTRKVRGGTVVRTGLPNGWGRVTDGVPLSVAGEAPIRITADGHETRTHHLYGELKVRHSPGSILDVAVQVDRRDPDHHAAVKLIGVGLPDAFQFQTATIPAGKNKGYISFYLPPTLPVGRYTIAVQGATTVPFPPNADKSKQKTKAVTVFSNPVTFDVQPAAFVVAIDPYVPRKIGRGKIVQVKYTVKRINGFINKVHTELAHPDKVIGLRGRGVTFVGQTESGTVQIIANDDAPLGKQPFLRLYAVGVLEDEAVFHGSCFLNLEIVE